EKGRLADGTPIYRAHQRSSIGDWVASVAVPQHVLNHNLYGLWVLSALFVIAAAIGFWAALRLAWQFAAPVVGLASAGATSLRGGISTYPSLGPTPGPTKEVPQLAQTFKEPTPSLREALQQAAEPEKENRSNEQSRTEPTRLLRERLASASNIPEQIKNECDFAALDLAQLADKLIYGWHCDGRFARHTITTYSESVWARVDRTSMERILSSLLSNALKHTPPGGHIEVTIFRGGEYAVLRVSDDGEGMRLDTLDDLFSPFLCNEPERATDRGDGLAMTQQLVEQQGGSINICSEGMNKGTRFAVLLPAIEEPHNIDPRVH
ncbi:MAG TPA: ATP-binding protein, partial [Burkholderiales bacterium]|nr:ATP-binding protein [Burkholderiales bacterium]